MLTQTYANPIPTLNFFSLPVAQQDVYTLDGEEQLADEMTGFLPEHTQNQPHPEIASDDFEKLYGWFLS